MRRQPPGKRQGTPPHPSRRKGGARRREPGLSAQTLRQDTARHPTESPLGCPAGVSPRLFDHDRDVVLDSLRRFLECRHRPQDQIFSPYSPGISVTTLVTLTRYGASPGLTALSMVVSCWPGADPLNNVVCRVPAYFVPAAAGCKHRWTVASLFASGVLAGMTACGARVRAAHVLFSSARRHGPDHSPNIGNRVRQRGLWNLVCAARGSSERSTSIEQDKAVWNAVLLHRHRNDVFDRLLRTFGGGHGNERNVRRVHAGNRRDGARHTHIEKRIPWFNSRSNRALMKVWCRSVHEGDLHGARIRRVLRRRM